MPQRSPTERLARLLDAEGRVVRWPAKRSEQLLVIEYLGSEFEADRRYTELEVNALLKGLHCFRDWALLRRELFEQGLLGRTADGTVYWRVRPPGAEP